MPANYVRVVHKSLGTLSFNPIYVSYYENAANNELPSINYNEKILPVQPTQWWLNTDPELAHSDDSTTCESLTKHISCTDEDDVRTFAEIRWEFSLPDVR